jgi:hypothetical protein
VCGLGRSIQCLLFQLNHKEKKVAMADQVPQSPTLKDLPKVQTDLKSQLEQFDPSALKNVDPQEKVVLPTAEGDFMFYFFNKHHYITLGGGRIIFSSTCLQSHRTVITCLFCYLVLFIPFFFLVYCKPLFSLICLLRRWRQLFSTYFIFSLLCGSLGGL